MLQNSLKCPENSLNFDNSIWKIPIAELLGIYWFTPFITTQQNDHFKRWSNL